MPGAGPRSHLHKNQRAPFSTHHKINLTPTTPRRPIIAINKTKPGCLQVRQGCIFG